MREKPVTLYLRKLEKYRIGWNMSRVRIAEKLGVPVSTYTNCYRNGQRHAQLSAQYTKWIRTFLAYRRILSADTWM